MSWQAAPSVRWGLDEATRLWPERNKASDGIIGDAAHAASVSDHNPDSRGIVHAFDLTHDPKNGVDCSKLFALLLAKKDSRIRYVIWNRQITYGPWSDSVRAGKIRVWSTHPYTLADPHTNHIHVSIGYSAGCENSTASWWTGATVGTKPPTQTASSTKLGARTLKRGDKGSDVAYVQRWVGINDDGDFGPATEAAVIKYQKLRGLHADGVVGPLTWKAML